MLMHKFMFYHDVVLFILGMQRWKVLIKYE